MEYEKPLDEGEAALTLVLGLMVQLGKSGTLKPKQLDGVLQVIIDLTQRNPHRKAQYERLRSYQKAWSTPNP